MKDDSDVGRHESVTESKDSQNVDAVAVRSVFFRDFSLTFIKHQRHGPSPTLSGSFT